MLIGEVVKKTGLGKDTIRFYEKEGLIVLPKKSRRDNNYKEYPDGVVNKLLVIQQLKEFGFTLAEISELVSLYEAELISCVETVPMLKEKINKLDEKINQLKYLKERLIKCIDNCPDNCEIDLTLGKLKNN